MGIGGGFDKEELNAPMSEINTTPLVDVMLVLLVIFLVTAPMLNHAVKLNLPAETTTEIRDQKAITISIDASGAYYWNDQLVTVDELEQRLNNAAKENQKQPLHLRADTDVPYGKVSHFLATAQRLGLSNLGFLTSPQH